MLNYDCGGLLSEVEQLRADNDRLRSLQARLVTRELFDTVAAHRDRLAAELAAAAGRLRVLADTRTVTWDELRRIADRLDTARAER